MMEVISMRFDEEMILTLKNTGKSVSDTVREAINFYLDNRDRIKPEYEKQLNENEKLARYWTILANKAPAECKYDIKKGNLDNLRLVTMSFNDWEDTRNVRRIKEMLPFFHISYDTFIRIVCDALENGDLSIKDGKLDVISEYRLDELIETCRKNNVNPGRAIHLAELYVKEGKISCNS